MYLIELHITSTTAYMLMKIPADPLSFIGSVKEKKNENDDDEEKDEEEQENVGGYLDTKTRYLKPVFLLAWWDLREHIENYELTYFFEV